MPVCENGHVYKCGGNTGISEGASCPFCEEVLEVGGKAELTGEEREVVDSFEVIASYSRAQAIEDCVLVDVSSMAKEAGLKFPTAVTRAVWEKYVEVPKGVACQDEQGRLWDILWMLRCAAQKANGAELQYKLYVRNDNGGPRPVTLKALCGPSDNGEPVITIMLPEED